MEAIEWRHLPDPGGLLDQDERLMENIFTVMEQKHFVKEHDKANQAGF